MFKKINSLFTNTAMLVIFIAMAGVQDAAADEKSGEALVGSWTVLIMPEAVLPPVTDLTTVNSDGTMTNSDAMLGTGHGVWKYLGDSQFAFKFMTPVLSTDPSYLAFPGSILTVTGTLTVDNSGTTANGPFKAMVEHPKFGPVFGFSGEVAYTRISIDDQHYDDDD